KNKGRSTSIKDRRTSKSFHELFLEERDEGSNSSCEDTLQYDNHEQNKENNIYQISG
ncbi:unnamed protein product, partial [Heterosigma akashiwo]